MAGVAKFDKNAWFATNSRFTWIGLSCCNCLIWCIFAQFAKKCLFCWNSCIAFLLVRLVGRSPPSPPSTSISWPALKPVKSSNHAPQCKTKHWESLAFAAACKISNETFEISVGPKAKSKMWDRQKWWQQYSIWKKTAENLANHHF